MAECGLVEARCSCILPEGHETPHVCACGGSFSFDRAGAMTVYAFPPGYEGGLRLTQEQAVAKANEYIKAGPANVGAAITAFLGFEDEDESLGSEGAGDAEG